MSGIKEIVERSYSSKPRYTEIMAGLPENYKSIGTLGELLEINYKIVPSREQIRRNLIILKERNEPCYPGIIGLDDDVVPALDRALLACHDALLIGQIGQAKTRLIQTLAENLLSPMPVIRGSITNDSPMDLPADRLAALLDGDPDIADPVFHVSPESIDAIRDGGLETPVSWIEGGLRYKYVLATPDISIKDLIGYIDAIKVAKRGIEMYRIESYSPGQIMQAKHGIFCIDELPVLDPRKQVALLSVLQEGRFTTGSYPVTFRPRTVFFATANPVDYTHSGKVIEPLFDRMKSHIRTRYPRTIQDEMMIMLQEAEVSGGVMTVLILRILATLAGRMRNSGKINQERGVSARLAIHGLEILAGEAERTRGIPMKIAPIVRHTDLHALAQVAKFELADLDDTASNRSAVFSELLDESVREVSRALVEDIPDETLQSIKAEFEGRTFQVSQQGAWSSYLVQLEGFPTLKYTVESKAGELARVQDEFAKAAGLLKIDTGALARPDSWHDEILAAIAEAVLEGLCWTSPRALSRQDAGYAAA